MTMVSPNEHQLLSHFGNGGDDSNIPGKIERTKSAPGAYEIGMACVSNSKRRPRPISELRVVNWNVAAPNNNPFEYWATHEDEEYLSLMTAVQQCIDHPKQHDVRIGSIFTQSMFAELIEELSLQGVTDLDKVDIFFSENIAKRWAIEEFLKDPSFGEKRLISMPDRVTSSIKVVNGPHLCRPSPITGSKEDIRDIPTWWVLWKTYMFKTAHCVRGKTKASALSMIGKIPRSKYPALSESEEALSVPLQVVCLAVFDAIFTYILSCIAPATWQSLKRSLHTALFENKAMSCVSILRRQYSEADIIFVQEASESFAAAAGVCLDHIVLRPSDADGYRSQTSLILVRRTTCLQSTAREVTDEIQKELLQRCVDKGDLCAYELDSHDGPFLLASFHGDSEGAATLPVLTALEAVSRDRYPLHTLILGLDANTSVPSPAAATRGPPPLRPTQFQSFLAERGLISCWEDQDLESLWTTFNARTYLQPQLHKAVGQCDLLAGGHTQLKDWVVFRRGELAVGAPASRDNTGDGQFLSTVMPSLRFPSDHALVAVTLVRVADRPPPPRHRCR